MSTEIVGLIITILFSFIGAVIWLLKITFQLGRMELKINTLWDFVMKRALGSTVSKGFMRTRHRNDEDDDDA